MSIIGLGGPALVGKDTVAKHLQGKRLAFADKLKDEACQIGKIGRAELESRKPEIRFFLEALGAYHRLLDPNHWIDIVKQEWEQQGKPLIKITDLRHLNEAVWIHGEGGIVVYLHRKGVEPCSAHEAKNLDELCRFEHVIHIHNDGTPEETAQLVIEAFNRRRKV